MRVSVVTPLWRTNEDFVAEAVRAMDTVLSMDTDRRIGAWRIVIDGGRCDYSRALDQLRPSNRSRVSVLRLNLHAGISKAKNIAVQNCNTDYISWFDGDDSLDPQTYLAYLDFAINALERDSHCVSVFSSHWDCDSDLRHIALRDSSTIFSLHKKLAHTSSDPTLYVDIAYHSQVLRRIDFVRVNGFSDATDIGEDVRLTHRLLNLSSQSFLGYSTLAPYLYRRNPNGITKGRKQELRNISTSDFQSIQAINGVVDYVTTTYHPAALRFDGTGIYVEATSLDRPEYNLYLPNSSFNLKWLEVKKQCSTGILN
jgi:glycosyltransferase involved in cell wall biosynthesis